MSSTTPNKTLQTSVTAENEAPDIARLRSFVAAYEPAFKEIIASERIKAVRQKWRIFNTPGINSAGKPSSRIDSVNGGD